MELGNVETGDLSGEERRRSSRTACTRLACSCTVKPESISAVTNGDRKRGALLLNLSVDGISFETDFNPSVQACMNIEIRPIEGPDVAARLKVIHARRSARSGLHVIGAKFEEINEHNRQNLLALLDTIGRLERNLSGA